MTLQILQREFWSGRPVKQGDALRLRKTKDGRERTALGELWSHQLGWELRLLVDGEFVQSRVCRAQDEVFDTADAWKAALIDKGWA